MSRAGALKGFGVEGGQGLLLILQYSFFRGQRVALLAWSVLQLRKHLPD